MFRETQIRTITKTITWRGSATLITILLVYIFFGKILLAAAVGGIEIITKLLLYYVHERIWNRIKLGKMNATPFILWFTGLSGAGKSTLANKIYYYLKRKGCKVEILDGDNIRSILPNTGFSKKERNRHIKKIGILTSILERNSIIVIASFISPYQESRDFIRKNCKNFIEIYLSTSIKECEKRDVKGLYKKVRAGKVKNFTGIDDPYEVPQKPEIIIDTEKQTIKESFNQIMNYVSKYI